MPPPDEEDSEYEDEGRPLGRAGEGELTPERDALLNPEDGYEYHIGGTGEEDIRRQEIANKFFTLSTEIGNSDERIKQLLSNRITLKQKRYAVLDEGREADFLKALESVNQNLGAAQAMLDAYIELDKSTPEFRNFYNKFYQLYELITKHRRSTFYNFRVERGEYLYPIIDIETKFGGLSFLFARLCGVLNVCGSYIKDSIYLTPRVSPGYEPAGGGYSGGYYPHYIPPSVRPDFLRYDDREMLSRERKQETRDIGDGFDKA